MKTTTIPRQAGLLAQPDDLQVGKHYAVYGIKNDPAQRHPIFGESFLLKAINLPFLVGQLVSDPAHPALTFDVRSLELMKVTPGFVKAQQPSLVPTSD